MPSFHPAWIAFFLLICFAGHATAFGAGNIPGFAFLEGKAFRHGDIEDILAELLIRTAEVTSGAVGFAKKAAGKKFSGLNVKRTYFGNWLRDYSQALDVGTLSKGLDSPTIRILVWVLGFMSFGYATAEFEAFSSRVTEERLGVYRPEEHIDNPKDYADNVDARQYDPRLRGPVDPRELQIDPLTGMKNYIANEQGGWATSTRYIRDSLLKAIDLGRRGATDPERYEALRLLGQALHTLEDLTAHSNWVELALIELGYNQVFPHVGTNTQIVVSGTNKRIWPLVTGTFGGADFIHSLLGEATDKISQTSVTDLNAAISDAERQNTQDMFTKLKTLVKLVPSGSADLDSIQQSGQALAGQGNNFHLQGTPGDGPAITAQEIAKTIYPILALRDKIMKSVTTAIDKIPGLRETVDELKQDLTVYVLSIIQPFIRPILRMVSENATKASAIVMTDATQYLVWSDPNSSDPTHSMLAKDHFSCYLNEPAGNVAKIIISFAVTQVVAAWSNENVDARAAVESVLQCFCHPALLTQSQLHKTMFATVKLWVDNIPVDKKARIFEGLTSQGVRQGRHHDDEKRKAEQQIAIQQQAAFSATLATSSSPSLSRGVNVGIVSQTKINPLASVSRVIRDDGVRHGPDDYSYNYHLAQLYASTSFQAQTSYSTVSQRSEPYVSTYTQNTMVASTPLASTSTPSRVIRLWPYNTDYYLQRDTETQPQQSYPGVPSQQMSPPYSPQEGSYQTFNTWSPTSTLSYSQTVIESQRGRGDSETTNVQESFQNMSLREDGYGSNQSYYRQQ